MTTRTAAIQIAPYFNKVGILTVRKRKTRLDGINSPNRQNTYTDVVAKCGVPNLGCILDNFSGRMPLLPIANMDRENVKNIEFSDDPIATLAHTKISGVPSDPRPAVAASNKGASVLLRPSTPISVITAMDTKK